MQYAQFMLIEWIKEGLKKKGKSRAGLAKHLGLDRAQITRMLNPELSREIRANELFAISTYFGEPLPPLGLTQLNHGHYDLFPILIRGTVAPGVWRDQNAAPVSSLRLEHSFFPPDPRFNIDHQFDMMVEGTSIERFAKHGALLRCADIEKSGISPEPDDLVIVERKRDGLVETSAKRYRPTSDGIELWPDSEDPHWQAPVAVSADELSSGAVKITAVVLYAYRPARKRAK
jgi:transcriptional regulator with XRE-family HTH domain